MKIYKVKFQVPFLMMHHGCKGYTAVSDHPQTANSEGPPIFQRGIPEREEGSRHNFPVSQELMKLLLALSRLLDR